MSEERVTKHPRRQGKRRVRIAGFEHWVYLRKDDWNPDEETDAQTWIRVEVFREGIISDGLISMGYMSIRRVAIVAHFEVSK